MIPPKVKSNLNLDKSTTNDEMSKVVSIMQIVGEFNDP
jgi:hypothetical protein